MPDNALDGFSLSATWQIVLAIATLLGLLVGIAGVIIPFALLPRKSNEAPSTKGKLRPIRSWHPSQFNRALGELTRFRRLLKEHLFYDGTERGHFTESDRVRWTFQLLLTAAAFMVPESLGKANLFRISSIIRTRDGENHTTEVRLYSAEFVGVFSIYQLSNTLNRKELRQRFRRPIRLRLP